MTARYGITEIRYDREYRHTHPRINQWHMLK